MNSKDLTGSIDEKMEKAIASAISGETSLEEDEVKKDVKVMPVTPRNKIGRNQPCPCGSGKKYKKCCLLKRTYTPGG